MAAASTQGLGAVAVGEDQDARRAVRLGQGQNVLHRQVGAGQLAVSGIDRGFSGALLEDFGGIVDEFQLVATRRLGAIQEVSPFREIDVHQVFGGLGAVEQNPQVEAVVTPHDLRVGEQKDEQAQRDDT